MKPSKTTTETRSVRVLRVGEQVRHVLSEILMRGEVHDENAYALGGASGHAGLFGHIDAVLDFVATGGYEADLGMQRDYFGFAEVYPLGTPANTGDGVHSETTGNGQIDITVRAVNATDDGVYALSASGSNINVTNLGVITADNNASSDGDGGGAIEAIEITDGIGLPGCLTHPTGQIEVGDDGCRHVMAARCQSAESP